MSTDLLWMAEVHESRSGTGDVTPSLVWAETAAQADRIVREEPPQGGIVVISPATPRGDQR